MTQELFEAKYNFAKAKSAYVFKTIMDPFIGKYSLFKVMSGVIKADDVLYDYAKTQEIRISKLYVMNGAKAEEVEELHAGDIGALSKVAGLATQTSLSSKATPVLYPPTVISTPYCAMRYYAADAKDDDKLTQSLLKLAEEDRTLRVENDSENRQTLVRGISEQHLQAVADRLKTKYNVEMKLEPPKVAYRETVRGNADVEYKHKKQSGGHGQYGHVKIQVDPLYDGSEFAFVDKIFGGAVPKQYIPAVEKGAKETLDKGLIAGYPMIGVQVTLLDGSYHSVDSSELAFKVATSQAIKDVIPKAKPVLLEPIYEVNVFAPDAFMGDIMGDLNSRRGRVLGMEQSERTGISVVKAQVPLAEMSDYVTALRSITQGQGVFNRQFYTYEEVPHKQEEEIIAAHKTQE